MNGHKKLADIFEKPVTFGSGSINAQTAEEALAASLNQFGAVNLAYMSRLCSIPVEELKNELQGRIYYHPLQNDYQLSDIFISGMANVFP